MKLYDQCSDEMLVTMYAQGTDEAFDELLSRYQTKVFNYILFLVHDQDAADDIFQDTFTKVILTIRAGRYVDSGRFGAWLSRIAHNLVIDHFRGAAGEPDTVSADETVVGMLNSVKYSESNVEQLMLHRQTMDDVRRYVAMLPPTQREVVYMRYYQDLSFKEIADITGVSINTSLGRMRYALINLRRLMNREGFTQ